jgi:hypothetical protein
MTDTELLTNADIEAIRESIRKARTMTSRFPMSDKQLAYALKLVRAVGVNDDNLDGINSSGASYLIDLAQNIAKPYLDAQRKEEDRKRAESDPLTDLGVSVGNKTRFSGTIQSMREVSSGFGVSTLLVLVNDKYRVKTFTSSEWVHQYEVGDTITIVGTVKGTDEFRGSTSTVLTRCRVVS